MKREAWLYLSKARLASYDRTPEIALNVVRDRDGDLLNVMGTSFDDAFPELSDFGVRLQYSLFGGSKRWWISWGYRNIYLLDDADRCASMAQILRMVKASMQKQEQTDGYSDDVAVLVLRIVRALGLRGVLTRKHADSASSTYGKLTDHATWERGYVVGAIRRACDDAEQL